MKKALITGVTGKDGAYLSELLLEPCSLDAAQRNPGLCAITLNLLRAPAPSRIPLGLHPGYAEGPRDILSSSLSGRVAWMQHSGIQVFAEQQSRTASGFQASDDLGAFIGPAHALRSSVAHPSAVASLQFSSSRY